MGAPTSPVDICNLALDEMQERANITSIEIPENRNEIIMARHYDTIRRGLLQEYIWNFSRAEAMLTRTGSGGFDYTDSYILPNDFIRAISIGDKYFPVRDFNRMDGEIQCNNNLSNSLKLRYAADVTDVSKFDDLFIKLFKLQLAWETCPKITKDKQLAAQIQGRLQAELPKAVSVNSQQKKPKRRDVSSTILARAFATDPAFTPDGLYWFDSQGFY